MHPPFSLHQYIAQIDRVRSLPPGVEMISGVQMGQMDLQRPLDRMLTIYRSMTFAEQEAPAAVETSAREQIASRAGISVAEVDQFINDYEKARMAMQAVERMRSEYA